MAREIKFRALDGHVMHYDVWVAPSGFWSANEMTLDAPHGNASTLMQFTGLRDKEGREVYDGDVVRMSTGRGRACKSRVVEFRDGAFRFPTQKTPHAGFIYSDETTEVIGNIYEDSEIISNQ